MLNTWVEESVGCNAVSAKSIECGRVGALCAKLLSILSRLFEVIEEHRLPEDTEEDRVSEMFLRIFQLNRVHEISRIASHVMKTRERQLLRPLFGFIPWPSMRFSGLNHFIKDERLKK